MVYGSYNYSYWGESKPTNITGVSLWLRKPPFDHVTSMQKKRPGICWFPGSSQHVPSPLRLCQHASGQLPQGKRLGNQDGVLSVGANVRNWFINPMNRPYLQVISTIDHSYWSYLHQLSYRLGAPLCRIAAGSLKKVRRIPIVQRREHGDFTNGIVMNLNLYKVGPHR